MNTHWNMNSYAPTGSHCLVGYLYAEIEMLKDALQRARDPVEPVIDWRGYRKRYPSLDVAYEHGIQRAFDLYNEGGETQYTFDSLIKQLGYFDPAPYDMLKAAFEDGEDMGYTYARDEE